MYLYFNFRIYENAILQLSILDEFIVYWNIEIFNLNNLCFYRYFNFIIYKNVILLYENNFPHWINLTFTKILNSLI